MKSILISIKPKYVADILNHKKTIEVRKSMPKCDLPIDVYIYCTKDNKHKLEYCDYNGSCWSANDGGDYYNGKVVAKFTLNKVEEIDKICGNYVIKENEKSSIHYECWLHKSCLLTSEISNYLKGKIGYAWHIDNLVIFDKPKELREFRPSYRGKCQTSKCKYCNEYGLCDVECKDERLTKAPQNMCYVEVE